MPTICIYVRERVIKENERYHQVHTALTEVCTRRHTETQLGYAGCLGMLLA